MSDLKLCDICGNIIKPGAIKVILVTSKTKHTTENKVMAYENYEQYFEYLRQQREQMEVKEICNNCNKVYEDLIEYRLQGVQKIRKKIDKILGIKKRRTIRRKKRKRRKKK